MANNNMKKVIAAMLAVSMMASHGGVVNAFAEGEVQESGSSTTVVSGSGTLEDPSIIDEIKTESSTDPETNETTTNETIESQWQGEEKNENGSVSIEGEEQSESTIVTDEEGNILEGNGSSEGSEIKTEVNIDKTEEESTNPDPVQQGEPEITEGDESEPTPSGDLTPVGDPEQVGEEKTESGSVGVDSDEELSVTLNPGEAGSDSVEDDAEAKNNLLEAYKNALADELPENAEIKEVYSGNTFVGYEIVIKGGIVEGEPVASGDPVVGEWSDENYVPTGNVDSDSDSEIIDESEEIILPAKPEESESVNDESGEKTVVTVNEIYDPLDSSKVIGYSTSTVVTDKDGKEISSSNENIYGTVVTKVTTRYSTTTNTEEKAVQTRTVTQTYVSSAEQRISSEKIQWNDISYRNMDASMGEVEAGANHGDTEMKSLESKHVKEVDSLPSSEELAEFAYKYVGAAAQWGYDVNTDDGTSSTVQLLLVDEKGNVHIAYCADLETYTQDGYRYDMENVFEASYYNQDAAEMIVAIASNGYWGTASGLGSLEEVKAFLKENSDLSESEINKLTEVEALTATQAAIWKYGNSGDTLVDESTVSNGDMFWEHHKGKWNTDSSERIQALYEALTGITAEEAESIANLNPVLATEETFATSSTITVGGKSEDEKYADVNNDDNADNDVYDTTINFTMAFMPTANDDLIVQILDADGKTVIAQRRLSGNAAEGETFGKINPTKNALGEYEYVIDNLPLAEGVNITLNLNGTQNLGQGVYLYSSEIKGEVSSQTFVGIAQGTRKVNLNVDLTFEVNEPTLDYKKTSSNSVQNYEREYESTREDVKVTTRVSSKVVSYEETVTEKVTEREWSNQWSVERKPENDPPVPPTPPTPPTPPQGSPQDDDFPIDETSFEEITTILDEEVPLTNIPDEAVPLTGASSLWNMIALISIGGLAAIKAAEKKRR